MKKYLQKPGLHAQKNSFQTKSCRLLLSIWLPRSSNHATPMMETRRRETIRLIVEVKDQRQLDYYEWMMQILLTTLYS